MKTLILLLCFALDGDLMQYVTVGYSGNNEGQISPTVFGPNGWEDLIEKRLTPVNEEIGPVDLWLHRTGGVWPDYSRGWMLTPTQTMHDTIFEAMYVARKRLPSLMDFTVLADYADTNGMDLYGYVGFPRADQGYAFTPVPQHSQLEWMSRWYGEFIFYGFDGVAHDWTSNLPPDAKALSVNFPYLEQAGLEVFIEAVPRRRRPHLLGYSVCADEVRWNYCEQHPEEFFTEAEIIEAGGRAIHWVLWPKQPVEDVNAWRFKTAKRLRSEGKTVAVALDLLLKNGHPIHELLNPEPGPTLPATPMVTKDPGGGRVFLRDLKTPTLITGTASEVDGYASSATDWTMRNFIVDQPRKDIGALHRIAGQRFLVEDSEFHGSYALNSWTGFSDATFLRNLFKAKGPEQAAVRLYKLSRVEFTDCTFVKTEPLVNGGLKHTLRLNNSSEVKFTGCTFEGGRIIIGQEGKCTDIELIDCVIKHTKTGVAINIEGGSEVQLVNCTITSPNSTGVAITGNAQVEIIGGTVNGIPND